MRNAACTGCPLHATANTVCLYGSGPANAEIMLVGEAPGAEEDGRGLPFIGQAGGILDKALTEAGIDRRSVYVTNTVKCRPPGNRTPEAGEVQACLGYLLDEIEEVKPKLIVAMGNVALKALTGEKQITKVRGQILGPRRGLFTESTITATIHPAATLRPEGQRYYPQIVEDFSRSHSLIEPHSEEKHAFLVPPGTADQEALAALDRLNSAPVLAVDAEWTAGKGDTVKGQTQMVWPWSRRGEMYSVSISGRVEGRLHTVALAWPPSTAMRAAVTRLLACKPAIFHNAMADLLWLRKEQVPVRLTGDTMILAYLLDETQSKALETVAVRYSPDVLPGWKAKGVRYDRPVNADEWRDLLKYNGEDTRATLLAWEGIGRELKALPEQRRRGVKNVHRLLMKALPVLLTASYVGVPIDQTYLAGETERAHARLAEALDALCETTNLPPIKAARMAASPDQTLAFIRGHLAIPVADTTKETLAELIKYPAVRSILRYRQQHKLLKTYFEPWGVMVARQGDGRLHSVYRPTGTRTGRLSAESEIGGSLQVAPRGSSEVAFRRMIRAPHGRRILSADFSQIELRVIAWLANEPTMRSFYREGLDIHRAVAAYLLALREVGSVSIEDWWPSRETWMAAVTKEQRQGAKGVNFGLGFGMQPTGLAAYAKLQYGVEMTFAEAQFAHRGYFKLFSALHPWHQRAMYDAAMLGWTETPFGRRRSFEGNDTLAAINTPVQSTASDLTLLALIGIYARIRREGLDARIIGTIHDSILIEVSEAEAEYTSQMTKYEMENLDTSDFGFTIPVPLVADITIGETWG